MHKLLLTTLGWFFMVYNLAIPVHAGKEVGIPLLRNYVRGVDYSAHAQNWGVTQGKNGHIYAVNTEGVISFDGGQWTMTRTPKICRSVGIGRKGTIYVGLTGEFGFLGVDAQGTLVYHSLLDQVPPTHRTLSAAVRDK